MTGATQASRPPDEKALLVGRRTKAGLSPEEAGAAGVTALALSGGGIRSATFCLGLVRALAANQVLRRFDYLSTVSGGGYAGSAISRLYTDKQDAKVVEDALARDDSVFLWWLRSNGRYLTPAGLADLGQAFASIARGVLSTHFEVGMLLFLAAAAMLVPYVAVPWLHAAGWLPAWSASWREVAGSFWWWVAAVPFFLAAHHIFAYWFRRSTPQAGSAAVDAAGSLGGVVIAVLWGRSALAQLAAGPPFLPSVLSGLGCLVLLAPASAFVSRAWTHRLNVSQVRLKHTKGLARAGWAMLVLGLLGALDWGTWKLAQWVMSPAAAALTLPSLAVVIGAIRLLLSRISNLRVWLKAQVRAIGRIQLVNAIGLLLLLAVVVLWATAFQWLLQAAQPWAWLPAWMPAASPIAVQSVQWLLLLLLPLAYVVLTRGNLELLNLSSLHNFYRARIERAYVSTGNPHRFREGILTPRRQVDTTVPEMRLAEAIEGDDVDLAAHRPHDHGGPIHLLNCCINQTVDDRTGTYNADRKGVCVTVSALGAETGTHAADGDPVPGKLSMWAAISGAAASSGMGSRTSPGLAALLFLSGMRLGYWLHALGDRGGKGDTPIGRPRLVVAEALARFPGLQSPQWYLSDGGHFDNTGVYPLLKRKAELIVLADCGADPDYRFEDLENLVRKAEIDYGAFIEFIRPPFMGEPGDAEDDELRFVVGRPSDFARAGGSEFLLLGRCRYADDSVGALVVVKPRLVPGLPLDIAGYARQDAPFPQQGTGDQFFDEAQWEAYHQLAWHLGRSLTHANLKRLQRWAFAA